MVVVGGGPTGLELALHLDEHGCSARVVEILPRVGTGLESITRKVLLAKLRDGNNRILTETKLLNIESNGAVVIDKNGQEQFIVADRIVMAIGTRPDNRLHEEIKSYGYTIYQVGDCLESRTAKEAIYESAVLGRSI